MFLLQMTAQACISEWPVVLYYIERLREKVLPSRPLAGGDKGATQERREDHIRATQERRDNHRLFWGIDRADWLEIYQRIISQPRAVAERLHIDINALSGAMPSVRAALGTIGNTIGSSFTGGDASSTPSSSKHRGGASVPPAVFEWCRERRACISFQLGKCKREACGFQHIQCPREVYPISRPDKKEKEFHSGGSQDKERSL